MKLWLLRPISDEHSVWVPWYDKTFGFVVRAEDEDSARKYAAEEAGYEGGDVWLDPNFTTCEELTPEGDPGIVIEDYRSA